MVAAASTLTVGASSIAQADTARVVRSVEKGRAVHSIVITGTDGTERTLGRYDFSFLGSNAILRVSPDRRWIAVVPAPPGQLRTFWIVPTDGGPARTHVAGKTARFATARSGIWWTADSRHLIVGDTWQRGTNRAAPYRSLVLRCPLAARNCRPIPGVDGVAATVPGGIVTSTAVESLLPFYPGFVDVDYPQTMSPDLRWRIPTGQPARLRPLVARRRVQTTLVASPRRTLVATTSSLADGVDGALAAVGGPAGALIVHQRVRTRITRGSSGALVRWRPGTRRWTLIDPTGTQRTVVAPTVRIPADLSSSRSDGRDRRVATVLPRVPLASGGWIGVAESLDDSGGFGAALTTIDQNGRAQLVRTDGRLASAAELIRTTLGRRALPPDRSLSVVGYEATTNAAVAVLYWAEQTAGRLRYRQATVRVPLDGQTPPSRISLVAEQEAW